jgi:hypothetical protein
MINLLWTWEENGYTYTLRYDQLDNQIYNFRVYSDGFPSHKLSEYTSRYPKSVETFSELLEIIPIEKLRNLDLVDETRKDYVRH